MTRYLPSVAGLLMISELEILGRLLRDPARPFVVVLGGLKVSDKIGLIKHMLSIADAILIGGAMATPSSPPRATRSGSPRATAMRSRSPASAGQAATARCELVLPRDLVVARSPLPRRRRVAAVADVRPDEMALDIGPESSPISRSTCAARARSTGTAPWVSSRSRSSAPGPGRSARRSPRAGRHGRRRRRHGLRRAPVRARGRLTHVSTGGGASMEFLEGRPPRCRGADGPRRQHTAGRRP